MAGIPIIAKHCIQLKLYVERWSNPNELPDNIKEIIIEKYEKDTLMSALLSN